MQIPGIHRPDFPESANRRGVLLLQMLDMDLVKKTIELDQAAITRIKTALNAKSEKEAINFVQRQFDSDIQLAEATLNLAGKMNIAHAPIAKSINTP